MPGQRCRLLLHHLFTARHLASEQVTTSGGDALCQNGPWSKEPKTQGLRAAVGVAHMEGHHPCRQQGTTVPHQGSSSGSVGGSHPLPPHQCHLVSRVLQSRGRASSIWQGTGSCAGRGQQAEWEGGQKEIH